MCFFLFAINVMFDCHANLFASCTFLSGILCFDAGAAIAAAVLL